MASWTEILAAGGGGTGLVAAVFTAVTKVSMRRADIEQQRLANEDKEREDTQRIISAERECQREMRKMAEHNASKFERVAGELGELRSELSHCRADHDENKAIVRAMRDQMERMERKSTPPVTTALEVR